MKAFIISNGQMSNNDFYLNLFKEQRPDYVICADGGANHLKKLGIIPNTIIGDLDSISIKDLEYYKNLEVEIIKYPTKKDETDTQLAIQYATTLPIKEIVLLGVIGDRIDHSLGNIYLMEDIVLKGLRVSIINENNIVYLINKEIEIYGLIGEVVSLLPYSDKVTGILSEGLEYPLYNKDMIKSNPYGISNVINKKRVKISIQSGLLLVILSKDLTV
ncbi:MAG TPA: thiamine diphosphokinase [Eubacteriaceae bacterium]|nr:thiamine diphosphokinase [Eubacteriaceae bacterium]